jgi:putative phosphoesterase
LIEGGLSDTIFGMAKYDMAGDDSILVGVIADTHGVLSEQVVQALQGVSQIIHAGDVDEVEVLEQLGRIAPVSAVRGNMDHGPGLEELPATQVVQVGEKSIYVLHDLGTLEIDPAAAGIQLVIYGHYHRPERKQRNGVLYLNPGSASFPRMGTRKSLALLRLRDGTIESFFHYLD